jgi:hypothetical protein
VCEAHNARRLVPRELVSICSFQISLIPVGLSKAPINQSSAKHRMIPFAYWLLSSDVM